MKFEVVAGDAKYALNFLRQAGIKSPIMLFIDGLSVKKDFDNIGPITSVYSVQDLMDNEDVLNGSKIGSIILYVKEK
jgi:asparagine synthetase A